jgi:hypothetical protein
MDSSLMMLNRSSTVLVQVIGRENSAQLRTILQEFGSAMDASKLQECFNLARIAMDLPSNLLKDASR